MQIAAYFELSRHTAMKNVRPMEGLRGAAVFMVFLVHYVSLMEPWTGSAAAGTARWVHAIGNAGVDLFFLLSGYLIYGSLVARRQPFLAFMQRRVQRIYPAFACVFVIYLILSFLAPAASKIPSDPSLAALYLAQNFALLPGLFPIEPMIAVAWSLSYEMFYYLVLPGIVGVFAMRTRSTAWRVGFFVLAGAAFTAWCAVYGGPVRLIMFIAGILLFEDLREVRARTGGMLAVLAVVGAFALMPAPIEGPVGSAIKTLALFASFYLLCRSCIGEPNAWLGRAFSATYLRWLGNMSYSYYLVHGLALKVAVAVLLKFVPTGASNAFLLGMLPVLFAVSLAPSIALFLLVERPYSIGNTAAKEPAAVTA